MPDDKINHWMDKFIDIVLFKGVCIVLIGVAIVLALPGKSEAIGVFQNFGGRVALMIPCTCPADPGLLVTIVGPRPGVFFLAPTTKAFLGYYLRPGLQAKGLAIPGTFIPCAQFDAVTGCTPPTGGGELMERFGASLL